ncbi:MAG: 4-hydroxy-tetrahydrodipicolinate reductase, partial [Pseudomonadota bacterium]
MPEKTSVVITGASGRMGQMLVNVVGASEAAELVGVLEREGHPWIGEDVGEAMGGAAAGVRVTDDPLEAFAKAQAVIDFTAPAATVA